MAGGRAHAFLQRLTDSIGGRVTGSAECRAAADLLINALRQAGFDDAHVEEYALESRWQRGRATGRVAAPVQRAITVGSYGWVPGTKGEGTVPLSIWAHQRAALSRSQRIAFEGQQDSSSLTLWRERRLRSCAPQSQVLSPAAGRRPC